MKKLITICAVIGLMVIWPIEAEGTSFDGVSDNAIDSLGYYYAMTGGKFPTGTTPNGDNASGGTFRFVTDDPVAWGRPIAQSGVWQKDGWFPQNAGLAVTLMNGASIVYDNNGIEDNSYGNYYNATGLAYSGDKPGLYRGYSMSNNWDWIYAGYFKIESETTVTELIGYFDENAGFDRNSPYIRYRMNIWSNVQGDLLPVDTGGFDGDVFSSDTSSGTFATSDTGVDRIFGDDYGNMHDDIFRLSFVPDQQLVLQPGEYWFSHDAAIVPEPLTMLGIFGGITAVGGYLRKRK